MGKWDIYAIHYDDILSFWTLRYSFFYLVIRHQNPFTTVTQFSTIFYPASRKLTSKAFMAESF